MECKLNRQDLANLVIIHNHMTTLINSVRGVSKPDINALSGVQQRINQVFVDEVVRNTDALFAEKPEFDPMTLAMLLADNKSPQAEEPEAPSAQESIEQEHSAFVNEMLTKESIYLQAMEKKVDPEVTLVASVEKETEKVEVKPKVEVSDDVKSRVEAEKAKVAEKLAKEAEKRKNKLAAKNGK